MPYSQPKLQNLFYFFAIALLLISLISCSTEEVKRAVYETGAQHECQRAHENRADSGQRAQDCLTGNDPEKQSYDEYQKEREKILKQE
ncbi:MAG: hypothetical protein ACR2PS_06980 [Pseudomonadales bacterium]